LAARAEELNRHCQLHGVFESRISASSVLRVDIHHEPMAQALRMSTSTEVLAGLVERVTFHNTENGFCVCGSKLAASVT